MKNSRKLAFSCLVFLANSFLLSLAALGQGAPAAITTQPASVTANSGQAVTINVVATGNPTPTIQWFKDGTAIAGATSSSLTFASVYGADAGSYTARVANIHNGVSYNLTTSTAVLTVITTPPTITSQPVSRTVTAGGSVTFSVSATGSGPITYQWYRDGVEVAGATGASLTISRAQMIDQGEYRVFVNNWATGVISVDASDRTMAFIDRNATLWTVGRNDLGQLGDGTTIDRLTPVSIVGGVAQVSASSQFTIFLKTDGTLWGTGVNESGIFSDERGNSPKPGTPVQIASDVASVSAGSYHVVFVKTDGTLWAVGTNSSGQLGDGTNFPRSAPVKITDRVATASAGGSHTTFVKTDGTLWGTGNNFDGQLGEDANTTKSRVVPVQIARGVASVSAGGAHTMFVKTDGTLWATGWNALGQLGDGTTTNQWVPVQVASGVARVSAGGSHTMFVKSDGTLWATGSNRFGRLGDGTTTQRSSPITIASGVVSVSCGDQSMFVRTDGALWGVGSNWSGQLGDGTTIDRVTPIRIAGGLRSQAASLVINTPPSIDTQPISQTVVTGSSFTLSVVAAGNPAPDYQWRKAGVNIVGATSSSYTIQSAMLGDAGGYSVIISNSIGSIVSNEASITVNPPVPATITANPISIDAILGQPVALAVSVSGSPAPTIQWFKNGTAVSGATTTSYTIASVAASDAGTYTATVQNVFNGTTYSLTTSPAVLTVNVPPTLTTQPSSVSVAVGQAIALSVAASGSPAPSYQWRKGGVPIVGATGATYTVSAAKIDDAGAYTVVVSNAAGSVTSSAAQVTVTNAPPVITAQPTASTVVAGQSVTFSVVASGGGTLTYLWRKNGFAISGAASSTLTISPVSVADAGAYSVLVSNSGGSVASVEALLTVTQPLLARISNVSLRTTLNARQRLIFGLTMAGGEKPVLMRAVGPGLGAFGVSNAMPDPDLELYQDQTLAAANDNWGGGADLISAGAAVGAFPLGASSKDAVLLRSISGGRTLHVQGVQGGNVLVEAYDAGSGNTPRLTNVSARSYAGVGGETLIAGFSITGNTSRRILIRAVGPTLAIFGVPGALNDPKLEVFSGSNRIAENDNWAGSLSSTFLSVGAFGLTAGSRDAAIELSLPPDGYTVHVSPASGAPGEVLIEIYELP